MIDLWEVQKQALREIEDEEFRAAVEQEKKAITKRLSEKRWWHTLIPFTIKINWRNK